MTTNKAAPKRPNRHPVAATSGDVLETQLAKLGELFPECVAEGRIDFDKLRATLGGAAVTESERYSFTWAGKNDALALLQSPSRGTLVPCLPESVNAETTANAFIEGDNLEVLKLLFKPYFGRVKLIYIDPPYNTGNDFVYPDNFVDPLKNYLVQTGQIDDDGNLASSKVDRSGRIHSSWLSMMYPRLFLARQILRDDGLICVSIDDNELHHLRMLLNEVFGEENFVATIAWQKKDTPSNDAKGLSTTHEYIVLYQRSEKFNRNLLPRTEEQLENYKNPDNDPRGDWIRSTLIRKEFRKDRVFPVPNPAGRMISPPPGTSWRFDDLATFQEYVRDNRIWWGADNDGELPFYKRLLTEVADGVVPITWWAYEFAGSNRNAKVELRNLFDREVPFDTPKPTQLIKRLLQIATDRTGGDLVLDFFAGSGTTAHAVLDLNREDGGDRRFVLVQLPEPTEGGDYANIAEIAKDRIRRAIARISATPGNLLRERDAPEDLGFKTFKLAAPSVAQWVPDTNRDPDRYAEKLQLFDDTLVPGWTVENVLWEVALREGFGLNTRFIAQRLPNGNTVYEVTDPDKDPPQRFVMCLDEQVRAELSKHYPLDAELLLVCRDNALDDTAAANLALQCRLKTI